MTSQLRRKHRITALNPPRRTRLSSRCAPRKLTLTALAGVLAVISVGQVGVGQVSSGSIPRTASQANYAGGRGRVTQVAFVGDSRSGRVSQARDRQSKNGQSKSAGRETTSGNLTWKSRQVSSGSTGKTRSPEKNLGMNPPRRTTHQVANRSATLVDENGVRWSAPNREPRMQSTRKPLDPFKSPFDDRKQFEPRPTRSAPKAPGPKVRTVPVQTQIPQPKFSESVSRLQEDVPCERQYNGRNCCAGESHCTDAQHRFANLTVRDVDLDITPMLNPATSREVLDSPPERGLPGGSRIWKNRAGEVIVEGIFADFTNGRIRIETADGQLVTVPNRELSDDDRCYFAAWWGVPTECGLGDEAYGGRQWMPMTMTWKASAICHNPLYFEEVQLERYGHSAGPLVQPVVSGAHFFFNIAALPYKMGIHPMNECMYPLGTYREGDCAPWLMPPMPISIRGGLMEAGVITGGVFILP